MRNLIESVTVMLGVLASFVVYHHVIRTEYKFWMWLWAVLALGTMMFVSWILTDKKKGTKPGRSFCLWTGIVFPLTWLVILGATLSTLSKSKNHS